MESVDVDVQLPVSDEIEAVADVARADHELARLDRNRNEIPRDALLRREREWSEHRNALDETELRAGRHSLVDLDEPPVGRESQQRQDRADDEEGGTRPQDVHDDRRSDRAERHCAHGEPPEHAEDAREEVVGNRALQERDHGDVLHAVRGADDRQQEDRGTEVRAHSHQHDRQPPEDEREPKDDCEPARAERHRRHRSEHPPAPMAAVRYPTSAAPPSSVW